VKLKLLLDEHIDDQVAGWLSVIFQSLSAFYFLNFAA